MIRYVNSFHTGVFVGRIGDAISGVVEVEKISDIV